MKEKSWNMQEIYLVKVHLAGVDAVIYLEQTTELPM